jgi:ribonuclease HI
VLRLPATLERRLEKLIPRKREREQFVKEVVSKALDEIEGPGEGFPEAIGGTLHLYCDGGSRGNPGEAAVGCVLIDPESGKSVKEYREAIGIHTNNVAEYRAVISGLEMARKFLPNRLVVHLDSELVVKQLSGEYRVKMPSLQPLMEEVQDLLTGFQNVSFRHIPRAQNMRADRLVNNALDGQ